MMGRMSQQEFFRWQVYSEKIQPFGEFRDDLRFGMVMSRLLNVLCGLKGDEKKAWKPSDFILDLSQSESTSKKKKKFQPMPVEAMKSTLKGYHDLQHRLAGSKVRANG